MKYISSLIKSEKETWPGYFSRLRYAVLRRTLPKYRERSRLERLVGPYDCWDELVQYQFNILTGLGVKPPHALLDIGCGPLTVGLKMIPYLDRGNYVGVDLRPAPLIEGYRLIAKHSLAAKNPTLINSSSFGQEEIGSRLFDFVWMSQLSCHLDDDLMVKLFEQAQARLRPGGTFAFDIVEPQRVLPPGSQWSGFAFHLRPLEYYAALGRRFNFSMEQRGRIVDYGYPKRIDLHTNLLLAFCKGTQKEDRG